MTLQKKNVKYFVKERVLFTLKLCMNAMGDASVNGRRQTGRDGCNQSWKGEIS